MASIEAADGGAMAVKKFESIRRRVGPVVLWLACMAASTATAAAQEALADRLHAKALELLRQGQYPQAYARFIELANAGHPASARQALRMCTQGLELFGKDWDCAVHEIQDWARLAGVEAPPIVARQYPTRREPKLPASR